MARRLPSESNSSTQPAIFLPFLAIWVAMISIISVICGARSRKSSTGKSTPPLSSSPSSKAIQITHITKQPTTPSIALEISTHQTLEQELPPTPRSKDTSSSSSSQDQSIAPPSNSSSSTRKLMKSLSMKLHMSLPKIQTGKEEERRRRQQKQHQQHQPQQLLLLQQIDNDTEEHEDCLWRKSIILGERCRVSSDDEDAFFYDEKGNRVMAYTPRTPRTSWTSRSLPASRTSSCFDLELE